MPLFKIKKSKKYNVVSKNSYVISVQMLDNTVVECTLTAEGTGQECLDRVCQRLEIREQQFFGLRYVSKKLKLRWIELNKPLQRILEKHAHEPWLYFGVMFYVSDINSLRDDTARYQFYLQLKNDVIEGVLQCSAEQAVLLASYSLQAELGDHDDGKLTAEYLKDFVLLPRHMTQDDASLLALTQQAVSAHRVLRGVAHPVAELYYIVEAQQLDGYGQECHPATDEAGNELLLGASSTGVFVRHLNGQPTVYFRWSDIVNMEHNKRLFGIVCSRSKETVQFQMEDPEMAKYVWKLCVLQHKFYMRSQTNPGVNKEFSLDSLRIVTPDFQQNLSPSHIQQDLSAPDQMISYSHEQLPFPTVQEHSTEQLQYPSPQQVALPVENLGYVAAGEPMLGPEAPRPEPHTLLYSHEGLYELEREPRLEEESSEHAASARGERNSISFNAALPPPPRVMHHSASSGNLSGGNHDDAMAAGIDVRPYLTPPTTSRMMPRLPDYRKSPDYDVVMEHLYAQQGASSGIYAHSDVLAYSQPDVAQVFHQGGAHATYASAAPTHTYSTPELSYTNHQDGGGGAAIHLMDELYDYKPPPPYARPSNSTPDLASQLLTKADLSSSSPDLISHRYLHHVHQSHQQHAPLDRTIENLAEISELEQYSPRAMQLLGPRQPLSHVAQSSHGPHGDEMQVCSYHGNRVVMHGLRVAAGNEASEMLQMHGIGSGDHQGLHAQGHYVCAAAAIRDAPSPRSEHSIDGATLRATETDSRSGSSTEHISVVTSFKRQPSSTTRVMPSSLIASAAAVPQPAPPLLLSLSNVSEEIEGRVPKDPRRVQLEEKLIGGQVFIEFEKIPKKRLKCDVSTAMLPENGARNRFRDVVPYEDNVIKLTPSPRNKCGYINASGVSLSVKRDMFKYIASQGPMSNTTEDFWQMVMEHELAIIIMLTSIEENGQQKCVPYWPQHGDDSDTLTFGAYRITRQFSNASECYVTSSLLVTHLLSGRQRSVWHIQYTNWPDHGCPENLNGFLAFLEETIDLAKALSQLRHQRMLMVQTMAQYKFVHQVLIQYLRNSRLI
ncbi:PREDICTED: tyrosine-protein phosphatase non-receptor type 21-like [Priapulus caudatus]|uniref:protein-tyrosine-phosphatase n=1 Tax=Priapulus caudatus TaxID=37621 RepID=A0ABM1DV20_PRICU|nr:PREDICTED: tyrosine-protein phosphatase non-receptor type 21-like [Priapulus caudatus]